MKLTKSELEIMETLWSAGRPLPGSEIVDLTPNRSWSPRTIYILLNSLLKKGAIAEAGFVKRAKTYSRLYNAKISGEDYYAHSVFATKAPESLPIYFSALIKTDSITPETITELEELLAERKKELLKEHE